MFFLKHRQKILQIVNLFFLQVQSVDRKRTSQFASKSMIKQVKQSEKSMETSWMDGSMTVETALVFPLFIFVLYAVFCVSQLFIASHEIHNGLVETARYAAKYAYSQKDMLTSQMSLNWKFTKYVDDTCLANIKGGAKRVRISVTEEEGKKGVLRLQADAKLMLAIPFLGTYKMHLQEVVYQKKFIGYIEGAMDCEQEGYVYVAETGSVYHTSLSCTHICLQIVPAASLADIGQRKCCQRCMKEGRLQGEYAAVYGDCIHNNLNCSGIKRTIRVIKKEQIGDMPQCSKCAGQN